MVVRCDDPSADTSRLSSCSSPKILIRRSPKDVWCHISGIDIVRDKDGQFYILEDNLRCPSGVSYVLENREVLKRIFPIVFEASHVRHVDDYPAQLLNTLRSLAPPHVTWPTVVLLTPGIYNSAYTDQRYALGNCAPHPQKRSQSPLYAPICTRFSQSRYRIRVDKICRTVIFNRPSSCQSS